MKLVNKVAYRPQDLDAWINAHVIEPRLDGVDCFVPRSSCPLVGSAPLFAARDALHVKMSDVLCILPDNQVLPIGRDRRGFLMPNVEVMSVEDAIERRAKLLRSLSMNEAEFRERAAKFQLTAEEMAVAEELRALDFLISE